MLSRAVIAFFVLLAGFVAALPAPVVEGNPGSMVATPPRAADGSPYDTLETRKREGSAGGFTASKHRDVAYIDVGITKNTPVVHLHDFTSAEDPLVPDDEFHTISNVDSTRHQKDSYFASRGGLVECLSASDGTRSSSSQTSGQRTHETLLCIVHQAQNCAVETMVLFFILSIFCLCIVMSIDFKAS